MHCPWVWDGWPKPWPPTPGFLISITTHIKINGDRYYDVQYINMHFAQLLGGRHLARRTSTYNTPCPHLCEFTWSWTRLLLLCSQCLGHGPWVPHPRTVHFFCIANSYMGKGHKNCIIGQTFCLHHITGRAFVTPQDVILTQDVIIATRCNTIYARCNNYAKCNNFYARCNKIKQREM